MTGRTIKLVHGQFLWSHAPRLLLVCDPVPTSCQLVDEGMSIQRTFPIHVEHAKPDIFTEERKQLVGIALCVNLDLDST